jgi:predicted Zn-dependent protease with MMP-like domain
MQHVNFETVVKEGYIKIPEQYNGLNNKKVLVEIYDKEPEDTPKRLERIEKFLEKYKGMLKQAKFSNDLDIKSIRKSRLEEKYDL